MNLLKLNTTELLTDLLRQFVAVIPRVVGAIIILILGLIIAKIAANIVKKVLKAIKADDLADKLHAIEMVDKSNIKIVPSKILSKVMYYVVFFVFMVASADFLGMEVVSDLIGQLIAYIPKLISAGLVLALGLWIADAIKGLVRSACNSLKVPAAGIISNFVFYFLFINILMMAMKQAGVNTDFLTSNLTMILGGIVGAFAIGYGFASKDSMANLLGGLYSKNKFVEGDEVKIGDVKGTIIAKDNTSLTIKTPDSIIIMPMGRLSSDHVEKFNSK